MRKARLPRTVNVDSGARRKRRLSCANLFIKVNSTERRDAACNSQTPRLYSADDFLLRTLSSFVKSDVLLMYGLARQLQLRAPIRCIQFR
jgi:hypothetical protein